LVFLRSGEGGCAPIRETLKTLFPEAMKTLRGSADDILTALNRILRILGRIFNGSYRHSYATAASGGGLLTLSTGPPSLIIDRYASYLGLFSQASESGKKSLGFCIQSRSRILENELKRTESSTGKGQVSDTGNIANEDNVTISLADNMLKVSISSGQRVTIFGKMLNAVNCLKALGWGAVIGLAAGSLLLGKPNKIYGATGDKLYTTTNSIPNTASRGCDYDNINNVFYYINDTDDKVYSRLPPFPNGDQSYEILSLESGDEYFGLAVGNGQIAVTNVTDCELEVYDIATGSQVASKTMPGPPRGVAFNGGWEVHIRGPPRVNRYNKNTLELERETGGLVDVGMTNLGDSELAFDSTKNLWYLIKGDDSGFYTFKISGSSVTNVNSWNFNDNVWGGAYGAGFIESSCRLITSGDSSNDYYTQWEGYNPPPPTPTPVPSPSPTPSTTPQIYNIDNGDYNGDAVSDIAIFRQSQETWSVRGITRAYFGSSNDLPVAGDFNNDGTSDMAVFRGHTGLWSIRGGGTRAYFGSSDDIPVPGDYNGDGYCDMGVFRASSGLWSIRNVTRAYLGSAGDIPVPGYFTGERVKNMAVFRPSSGLWSVRGVTRFYFGQGDDYPLTADFNGSGLESAVVFRKSGGFWAVRNITRIYLGGGEDIPIPADYGGGEGGEAAIFRPSSGYWAIRDLTRAYFGQSGDLPVAGRPCWPVTPTPSPIPSATPSPTASPTPTTGPTPMTTPIFTPVPTPSPLPG